MSTERNLLRIRDDLDKAESRGDHAAASRFLEEYKQRHRALDATDATPTTAPAAAQPTESNTGFKTKFAKLFGPNVPAPRALRAEYSTRVHEDLLKTRLAAEDNRSAVTSSPAFKKLFPSRV